MNHRVLIAGWPFAGLLTFAARHAAAALRNGVVAEIGAGISLLLLEPDGADPLIKVDRATALYGADGYPISLDAICIGDYAEAVLEKRGPAWVATEIHLV